MASPSEIVASLKAEAEDLGNTIWDEQVRAMAPSFGQRALSIVYDKNGFPAELAVSTDGEVRGDPEAFIAWLRSQRPHPASAGLVAFARLAQRAQGKDPRP